MILQTVSVTASGPAFSFLLYENLKNEFGQEGFLLGNIVERETKNITDNEQQQTYLTSVININGVIPCPHSHFFYNGVGKIDRAKLKSLLGDQKSSIIAWYRYKPASSFKLTFREKLIHRQLSEFFDVQLDLFTVCLCIAECTPNRSTHSFQQTFLRYKNNRFEPLPFHIMNLMDKKDCYKSGEPSSESFQRIIDKIDVDPQTDGVAFVTKLHEAIQQHVGPLVERLTKEEENLFILEEDIKQLIKDEKHMKIECTEEIIYDINESSNGETSEEFIPKEIQKNPKRQKGRKCK